MKGTTTPDGVLAAITLLDDRLLPQLVRRYTLPATGRDGQLFESADGEITFRLPDAPPVNAVPIADVLAHWRGRLPAESSRHRRAVLADYESMISAWQAGVASGGLADERGGLFEICRRTVCGVHRYKATAAALVRSPGSFRLVVVEESIDGEWAGVGSDPAWPLPDWRDVLARAAGRMPADDLLDCRRDFMAFAEGRQ